MTNRACDFSLSQCMGLYVRYLAERGLCVQTRAVDMVAGSQEPLNASVAGRCCSASLQRGTALVAQGFSAFQGARGSPMGTTLLCQHRSGVTQNSPSWKTSAGVWQGCRQHLGCKEGWSESRDPWVHLGLAVFHGPEALLPHHPLYSEHKHH